MKDHKHTFTTDVAGADTAGARFDLCVGCGRTREEITATEAAIRTYDASEKSKSFTITFSRAPEAESLKKAIEFLGDVMGTLVEKERGYGNIAEHVAVFAPNCTTEERIRTRLDEKLTRLKRLGVDTRDEDTLKDLVGYCALLAGYRALSNIEGVP